MPRCPLIVSQVNPDDGEWHEGIIANPNCSTMQLVPVLMALRDTVGLERVVVDTYQSVSGTGAEALAELENQIRAHVAGRAEGRVGLPAPDRVQRAARDRRLPRQRLHPRGVEGRHRESQDPAPAGAAGFVHGRARARLREPLGGGPRRDDPADHAGRRPASLRGRPRRRGRSTIRRTTVYPIATQAAGSDEVYVGRVRTDPSVERGLAFWVVSDNLRKGAATNAVEIAETLLERGWVKARSRRAVPSGAGGAS